MSEDLNAALAEVGRNCFCLHARMAARAVTRQYNAVLAPLGLEVTEFSLLGALAADEVASIAALADRLAFERTTLVRSLRRLADRGLIERADAGGRAVSYVLTQQGTRLLRQALPRWAKAQAALQGRLGAEADAEALRSLKALRVATLSQA
jgi:DNA-binding MarR family transcriptional regulator